jgi:paired amphipathic helix protein Sin3a
MRNGIRGRSQKEDSATGSKESTPDAGSILDDDMGDVAEDQATTEVTNERWLADVPGAAAVHGTKPLDAEDLELKADQPFKRDWYNLYCNHTVFVFFSIFHTLYRRFSDIKNSEDDVIAEVQRARSHKPAKDIGLLDDKNDYFGRDTGESYYSRTLALIEDFITGEIEEGKYQDFLRHYYLKKGWQLYTVTELLKSLCRVGAVCASADAKEKTPDLIDQFLLNREKEETSYNAEINLRKQAEKYIKDGELFLIRWWPNKNEATSQWIQKDETTFDLDDMERKERWQYYASSYVRIEPTEGVPRRFLRKSVLTRNLPSGDTDSEDDSNQRKPLLWVEDLTLRICVNSCKIIYKEPGQEWFIYADTLGGKGDAFKERMEKVSENRSQRFREKFKMNTPWMRNLSQGQVQRVNEEFDRWIKEGVVPGTVAANAAVPAPEAVVAEIVE